MATASKPKARTVADFKAAHDRDVIIPNKIRAGLAKLLEIGKAHYEYDEPFRSLCGIAGKDLATYRDRFKHNWFMTEGTNGAKNAKRVWFGNAKVAASLRPTPPDTDE